MQTRGITAGPIDYWGVGAGTMERTEKRSVGEIRVCVYGGDLGGWCDVGEEKRRGERMRWMRYKVGLRTRMGEKEGVGEGEAKRREGGGVKF